MESLRIYLNEIRTIPLLTPKQEIELSKGVKKGDEQARKSMIRANLRLVINIAKRYMYLGIPLLDLIEEGNLGLMRAVDKFNHRRGFRFSTYAAWWIRQSITRSLAEQGKMIRMPVYVNDLISRWKREKEQLAHKLKRIPTDAEIARRLKLSKDKAEQISFWMSTTTSSLEARIGEDSENPISDLIENETAVQPDLQIEQMFTKERVNNLLDKITEKEKEVIDMRFGLSGEQQHTLAEIAKKLGLSRERIRQIEASALQKVRSFVKKQEEE